MNWFDALPDALKIAFVTGILAPILTAAIAIVSINTSYRAGRAALRLRKSEIEAEDGRRLRKERSDLSEKIIDLVSAISTLFYESHILALYRISNDSAEKKDKFEDLLRQIFNLQSRLSLTIDPSNSKHFTLHRILGEMMNELIGIDGNNFGDLEKTDLTRFLRAAKEVVDDLTETIKR